MTSINERGNKAEAVIMIFRGSRVGMRRKKKKKGTGRERWGDGCTVEGATNVLSYRSREGGVLPLLRDETFTHD